MEIRVYEGEKFTRTRTWYITAAIIYGIIVLLALFGGNLTGVTAGYLPSRGGLFSAVLLVALGWGYMQLYHRTFDDPVTMRVDQEGITIGSTTYLREHLDSFVLEAKVDTGEIHNIILCDERAHQIYTIATSDQQTINQFALAIEEYIPLKQDYQEPRLEKITRRLKI